MSLSIAAFAHASTESPDATEMLLGQLTATLAGGGLADGTLLMEQALSLNVRWEQLTSAVREGIALSYERQAMAQHLGK